MEFANYKVIRSFIDVSGPKSPGDTVYLDTVRAAKLRRYGLIAGAVETAVKPEPEVTAPVKMEKAVKPEPEVTKPPVKKARKK